MNYSYVVTYLNEIILTGSNMKSIIEYLNDFCAEDCYFDSFVENVSMYNNDKLLGKLIFKEESDNQVDKYEFNLYKVDFVKPSTQQLRDDNIKDILDI